MSAFFLYPTAQQQLEKIWDYTKATWGVRQAEKYTKGLLAHCDKLCVKALRWKSCAPEMGIAVYQSRYEKHLLFFKEAPDGRIAIIAIIHEAMDIVAKLSDALKRSEQ